LDELHYVVILAFLNPGQGQIRECFRLDDKTTSNVLKENEVNKFFFLISNDLLKKAQRGATLVHREYTRERLRGAREEIKKL
jgi:hypothetical protein